MKRSIVNSKTHDAPFLSSLGVSLLFWSSSLIPFKLSNPKSFEILRGI